MRQVFLLFQRKNMHFKRNEHPAVCFVDFAVLLVFKIGFYNCLEFRWFLETVLEFLF